MVGKEIGDEGSARSETFPGFRYENPRTRGKRRSPLVEKSALPRPRKCP